MTRSAISLAIAALVVPLAGCGLLPSSTPEPTPTPEYRPEVIGVVGSVSFADGSVLRLVLDDGRRLDLDKNEAHPVLGGDPTEGDLFMYGTHPEPWFYAQRPRPTEDCYLVTGLIEGDVGAAELHFDFGLVLAKAGDFDPGSGNFRRPQGSAFCVNKQGEVTRLYE